MKKTIVILSHVTFDNSPYCSYVHSHAIALQKKGYNVIVFAILNWFPFISFFRKKRAPYYKKYCGVKIIDDITIIYKKRLSLSNFFYRSKLNINGILYYLSIKKTFKKVLKYNDVALIDAHTFKVEGYVAHIICKKYKIKTFLTCHGTSFDSNRYFSNGIYQIKKYCKAIDKIICVSNKIENQLNELDITNTEVIHNGINFYNKSIEKNNKNFNIVTVASLTSNKNVDKILDAFSIVFKKYRDAFFTIIGDGPLKDDLMKRVLSDEIFPNVKFEGQISNEKAHKLLSNSNIFILPSSPEGFGIVYVEAMYNGCITIGTKNEGIDGFIKNGENGFLVNIDSIEIANVILEIFSNIEKYDKLRYNGYMSARKMSWDNNASLYISLLNGEQYDR